QGSTRSDQTWTPIAIPEIADDHAVPFVRGVHELSGAHIDSGVTQAGLVGIGEDQHVAWPQVVGGDTRTAVQLARFVVRQVDAELAVDPHYESGTVEAGGRCAAPAVWAAYV